MAALAFGLIGSAVGAGFGGAVLGLSGAAIGGMIGSTIGGYIDSLIIASLSPAIRNEGPRLEEMTVMQSSEGAHIGRLYGVMRVGGNMIWSARFRETKSTESERVGGKGGGSGQKVENTTYTYTCSFAVAFGEGSERHQLGRLWMDGKEIDLTALNTYFYSGTETQAPDAVIQSIEGTAKTPAFRGICYMVFENMDLTSFSNRIPQVTAELIAPIKTSNPDDISNIARAFCLIPGSGEFVYGTEVYTLQNASKNVLSTLFPDGNFTNQLGSSITLPTRSNNSVDSSFMNMHNQSNEPDFIKSLRQLGALQPYLGSIALVVGWFGNDLRIGDCEIKPMVEYKDRDGVVTPREWNVDGLVRSSADIPEVGRDDLGNPIYGGTPSDDVVVEAIQWLKAQGYRVLFYPFLFMHVEAGNTLPNPYSDNAATAGQPIFPWRGRITCSPAAGFAGSVDKTATAATQVNTFFTRTWGFNRYIQHYAQLCADAGGVDAFLIASEMVSMNAIRSNANTYPAVAHLKTLAASVSAIMGSGTKVSYAADWSEYNSHRPADGSGDLYFHLDPLWSDANIDFIGVDNYLPLSDWRDGSTHLDYDPDNGIVTPHNIDYLKSNIEAGEGFDWYYASSNDRDSQIRTTITDGTAGTPWVYRSKDFRSWWLEDHYDRPGGVLGNENLLETSNNIGSASWTPISSPAIVTGVAGDPLGGSNAQTITDAGTSVRGYYNTSGTGAAARAGERFSFSTYFKLDAAATHFAVWRAHGPTTGTGHRIEMKLRVKTGEFFPHVIGSRLIVLDYGVISVGGGWYRAFCDFEVTVVEAAGVRMTFYPAFNADSTDWQTIGSSGAQTGYTTIFGPMLCAVRRGFVSYFHNSASSPVDLRPTRTSWNFKSKPIWFTEFGCPCVDKGTNQPNVFYDPKSSESFFPYYSTGQQDEYISRVYAEAMLQYWRDNSPPGMIDIEDMFIWCWDSRPFPDYPSRSDVWADGDLWRYGHWMTGRIAYPALPRLIENLCEEVGVTDHDTTRLNGTQGLVKGYFVDNTTAIRDIIGSLMTAFQFDAFESEGKIKFALKSTTVLVPLSEDNFVSSEKDPTGFSITRMQNSELPKSVVIDFMDAENDYSISSLDAKRHHTTNVEVSSIRLPVSLAPDYVRGLADSILHQAWVARESGAVSLPPSMFKLDPGDGITFPIGGRVGQARITSIDTGEFREVQFQTFDLSLYNLPVYPVNNKSRYISRAPGFPELIVMDIPLYSGNEPSHWSPRLAAFARPWPGTVSVFHDQGAGGPEDWILARSLNLENTIGLIVDPVGTDRTGCWLRNSVITVRLLGGTMPSTTEAQVLGGSNVCAMQNDAGHWELFQYATATLNLDGTYTLSKLIRGQLGTEWVMKEDGFSSGNAFVFLENQFSINSASAPYFPLTPGDRGVPQKARFGSAYKSIDDDDAYLEVTFTPEAEAKKPYAPVQLKAKWNLDVNNDIALSWVRRTRFEGDPWETASVPLNEEVEEYELEILNGLTVVRRVTDLSVPTYTYTNAMQVTDFGSAQTTALKFRVYQMSTSVGRGIAAEETITR